MSSALLFAAIAATGITYEWRSVDDQQGGHEYVVTVEPELMRAALDGHAKTFRSDVPAEVNQIRSVVVKLGEDRQPQRHGVLKPPVDEESLDDEGLNDQEFAPLRHSVYQQTYPPQSYPNSIEDGFRQANAATAEQRKSIGSELAKVGEKVFDETGRAIRNTGQMVEGTGQNLRDGLRSLVNPGVTQTAGGAPQPGSGYAPYSYSQPTAAPGYGASSTYPPAGGQPTPAAAQPYGTVSSALPASNQQQNWSSGPAAPALSSPASGQQDYRQQPQPQPTQPGYQPSNQQEPSGGDGRYNGDPSQYAGATNGGASDQAYVDFRDQRQDSYDDRFAPLANPQTVSNSSDYRQNQQPTGGQQHYAASNGAAGGNPQQPPASYDLWPQLPGTTPPASNQSQGQPPATNVGNYYAGYGNSQNQQGPDPAKWPGAIDGQNNGAANNQQSNQVSSDTDTEPAPWYYRVAPVIAVAAIGSIAWNFYLGMNYIDARNKYRAALRRSGRAYSEVLDDM